LLKYIDGAAYYLVIVIASNMLLRLLILKYWPIVEYCIHAPSKNKHIFLHENILMKLNSEQR